MLHIIENLRRFSAEVNFLSAKSLSFKIAVVLNVFLVLFTWLWTIPNDAPVFPFVYAGYVQMLGRYIDGAKREILRLNYCSFLKTRGDFPTILLNVFEK